MLGHPHSLRRGAVSWFPCPRWPEITTALLQALSLGCPQGGLEPQHHGDCLKPCHHEGEGPSMGCCWAWKVSLCSCYGDLAEQTSVSLRSPPGLPYPVPQAPFMSCVCSDEPAEGICPWTDGAHSGVYLPTGWSTVRPQTGARRNEHGRPHKCVTSY